MRRRRCLTAAAAVAIAGLTGCSGLEDDDDGGGGGYALEGGTVAKERAHERHRDGPEG